MERSAPGIARLRRSTTRVGDHGAAGAFALARLGALLPRRQTPRGAHGCERVEAPRATASQFSRIVWFDAAAIGGTRVLGVTTFTAGIPYHPQPRLVVDWERGALKHYGVPVRQVGITNFGDAIARDLVVVLPNSARGDGRWEKRNELSPGDTWWVMAPMVSGTDMVQTGMGLKFLPPDGGGTPERIRLVLSWRQAPFADKRRRQRFVEPREASA